MEKSPGHKCPKCGELRLSMYYDEATGLRLGAYCDNCAFKGYYADDKLVAMAVQ